MSYIIGSFNLRKMANTDKKNINAIAGIILQEHMDIVALQEVFRPEAIGKLIQALGPLEWELSWKNPEKNESNNANEGYAYIWRKRRLKKVETVLPNNKIRKFELRTTVRRTLPPRLPFLRWSVGFARLVSP